MEDRWVITLNHLDLSYRRNSMTLTHSQTSKVIGFLPNCCKLMNKLDVWAVLAYQNEGELDEIWPQLEERLHSLGYNVPHLVRLALHRQ